MSINPVLFNEQLTSAEVATIQNISGLGDPNADRILFWDDSAGAFAYLTAGSGLTITGTTITASGGGTGDFVGPASSTDNAIVRFDGTTGKLGQNSAVTIADTTGVLAGTQGIIFNGSTSGTTTLNPTAIAGTTTLTLPAATDTLVGKATTDTLTNKTIDADGTGNSITNIENADIKAAAAIAVDKLAAITASRAVVSDASGFVSAATTTSTQIGYLSAATGTTGTTSTNIVFSTSPTLTTPTIGVATATSVNKVAITAPATSATLTIADGKTLTSSNTLTLAGTDATVMTFPTTSATIARTDAANTFTGIQTMTSPAITTANFIGTQLLAENASIGQDPSLSADGKYTGITITGTAGAALAFGDLIYLDPTDSRWELTDANAASGADGDARGTIGICVLAAAADGDPTTILLSGAVRADTAFPALTINAPVYVSETAGDIVVTQPTTTDVVIRVLGFALTADAIVFDPSPNHITHT